MKDILSNEFKVAAELYRMTMVEKKHVAFNDLFDNLNVIMSKTTLRASLKVLLDWGIVYREARIVNGKAVIHYFVSSASFGAIRMIYDDFWKKIRDKHEV